MTDFKKYAAMGMFYSIVLAIFDGKDKTSVTEILAMAALFGICMWLISPLQKKISNWKSKYDS